MLDQYRAAIAAHLRKYLPPAVTIYELGNSLDDAELIALMRELEEKGLVENVETFKEQLIVERNADDRNRVDVLAPPDLVNQFRIFACLTRFVL